jgi:hypothetical protein
MTNKTDKNSKQTRSGTQSKIEQLSTDTNKRKEFRIEFGIEQYRYAFVRVQARSLAEAKQIAAEFNREDIKRWDTTNSAMKVMCVEPVEEGESHE